MPQGRIRKRVAVVAPAAVWSTCLLLGAHTSQAQQTPQSTTPAASPSAAAPQNAVPPEAPAPQAPAAPATAPGTPAPTSGQAAAPSPDASQAPQVDANGDYVEAAPQAPTTPSATPATLDQAAQQALTTLQAGGIIRGRIVAGTAANGKGGTPLPGVAITATNTLTGEKYSTVTDITGAYGMAIPKNGRYVVRAELSAFAAGTKEVVLNAQSRQGTADIGMELSSRVPQTSGADGGSSSGMAALGFSGRGTQALNLSNSALGSLAAGLASQSETALPSIAGGDSSGDSVAVSGASGSTSSGFNFEQARQGFENDRALQNAAGSNERGGPGGGGPGGGGGNMGFLFGGAPPGGGGRSGFRRFNPNQPHGSIVLAAQNSALNAQDFSVDGTRQPQIAYGNLRYGTVYTGPVIPGLLTSTKNFLFLSAFGNHGSTPFDQYGTVPTQDERNGIFPATINGAALQLVNPYTGQPYANNTILACTTAVTAGCLSPTALALEQYIPLPNQAVDSNGRNYRLLTSQTSNNDTLGVRFVRNFGSSGGGGMPLPPFMGGNGSKALRQNLNANFNYSHTGSDILTLFPDFRGKQELHQLSGNLGYTLSKGPWTTNLGASINRSVSDESNPYTSVNNIAGTLGIAGSGGAPFFYGLPSLNFSTFASGDETQASSRTNQVLGLSDSASYVKGSHNIRMGADIHRVNLNVIGGVNATGSFEFTGFATGLDFSDFLIGTPQLATLQTSSATDVGKFYFRANTWDLYGQDTWRVSPQVTVLYGLRYEYFSPYAEKYDHIANLDPNHTFSSVDVVLPNETGAFGGQFPHSLVYPDRNNFAPRIGIAWKAAKNTVVRTGYGVNYNTAQYGAFIQRLGYQPPFASAVNNSQTSAAFGADSAFTINNGLTASSTSTTCTVTPCITNNYAVDKNYRLGYVQVYNMDIQQTLGKGFVLNAGYNGSKGTKLDALLAPNRQLNSGPTTPNAEVFDYEVSGGFSNFNALAVRLRKRYQNNLSVGATYTYSHSIDDASSIGAGSQVVAQDARNLRGDEGNSSFDQRHVLKGDYLYELPFGPNQKYLSTGGWVGKALEGVQWSGDFTLSTGTPLNPYFSAAAAEAASGTSGSLRPDRLAGSSLEGGPSQINDWFNLGAFSAPCVVNNSASQTCHYGSAGRNSIPGPGTTVVDMAFSKSVQFGETKSLELRALGNNIFNIVQFADVDTNISSQTAGKVLSARAMRQFVLTARYRF